MPLVEKRYAEALIRMSSSQNLLDNFQKDLEVIESSMTENKDLRKFLSNPSLSNKKKRDALEKIFGEAVQKDTVNFLKILIDKGRMKNFSGILEQYKQLADEIRMCLNVKIISAEILPDDQLKKIGEKFRAQYGSKDVKVNQIVDASIIGGIIVKVGDKMMDGSVKGKLDGMLNAIS